MLAWVGLLTTRIPEGALESSALSFTARGQLCGFGSNSEKDFRVCLESPSRC
jgi:hypothetical protein